MNDKINYERGEKMELIDIVNENNEFTGEYRLITNLINDRIENLKKYKDFNTKYTKLYDLIDEMDENLNDKQKYKFNEIIKLIYETEEYYFALAYSLGVKYGNEIKNL